MTKTKKKSGNDVNKIVFVGLATIFAFGAYYELSRPKVQAPPDEFIAKLAAQGQDALKRVRTVSTMGNGHLDADQTKAYPEPFPTSGDHAARAAQAGFYQVEVPAGNLLHSMEHGNVVIYYEKPGQDALDTIKKWTTHYFGAWDGVLAIAKPGLGEVVVMTAWTKVLRLNQFDAASAAAFVDEYRGRGPENSVR